MPRQSYSDIHNGRPNSSASRKSVGRRGKSPRQRRGDGNVQGQGTIKQSSGARNLLFSPTRSHKAAETPGSPHYVPSAFSHGGRSGRVSTGPVKARVVVSHAPIPHRRGSNPEINSAAIGPGGGAVVPSKPNHVPPHTRSPRPPQSYTPIGFPPSNAQQHRMMPQPPKQHPSHMSMMAPPHSGGQPTHPGMIPTPPPQAPVGQHNWPTRPYSSVSQRQFPGIHPPNGHRTVPGHPPSAPGGMHQPVQHNRTGSRQETPYFQNGQNGTSSNVRVVLRVRPLNEREKHIGQTEALRVIGNNQVQAVFQNEDGSYQRSYTFDKVAAHSAGQEDMFHLCGMVPLLNSAIAGYATTVFAYGQTGSGKTYTMSGREDLLLSGDVSNPEFMGVIPRSMIYLTERARTLNEETRDGTRYILRAGYLEIYNEKAYDLLNNESGHLGVRWSRDRGYFVQDQVVVRCDSKEDMLAVLQEGHRNRAVGSHEMNRDSSRSHCILTVHIDSSYIDEEHGVHEVMRNGHVAFVDLAGSERLKQTKASGNVALKEAAAINRSLFCLGQVISTLEAIQNGRKPQNTVIPYRDSVITKLLMESLGGNGMTLMLACVTPSPSSLEESLNTISYAQKSRNIKNKPAVKIDPKDQIIQNLRQELGRLRHENQLLKDMRHAPHSAPSGLFGALSPRTARNMQMMRTNQLMNPPPAGAMPPLPPTPIFPTSMHSTMPTMPNQHAELAKSQRVMNNVMDENNRLQQKLEDLQRVFSDKDLTTSMHTPELVRQRQAQKRQAQAEVEALGYDNCSVTSPPRAQPRPPSVTSMDGKEVPSLTPRRRASIDAIMTREAAALQDEQRVRTNLLRRSIQIKHELQQDRTHISKEKGLRDSKPASMEQAPVLISHLAPPKASLTTLSPDHYEPINSPESLSEKFFGAASITEEDCRSLAVKGRGRGGIKHA